MTKNNNENIVTVQEETTVLEETSQNNEETTVSEEVTETTTETPASSSTSNMSMPFIGLSIVQLIIAFLLITVVLQQSKTASAMTSTAISGIDEKSYWNKNKARSKEGKLARFTVILGILFFIVTFIFLFF